MDFVFVVLYVYVMMLFYFNSRCFQNEFIINLFINTSIMHVSYGLQVFPVTAPINRPYLAPTRIEWKLIVPISFIIPV